ncbi:hypothetical protein QL112_011085 [Xenorhabdus griffiniae]|uniref:Uncharacterized protein n=2 Tax=Xenorhabdus griffiniae TaxID=351672 RepID=A0ABY9XCX8_9GAMM|nr:hypothetical protein [Xenorhabdus griffiniae]MBD1229310.1 hypothetical protein [Xenorhabdus griffiniae]MBE8587267.1 hypothetical protein [Xenorhabdus griffiniae]WMV70777.1 hypothetical protein QL128_11080 [Xenorhabdus griffiniae]WNH00453.1 hypothetical protein QL112_011085 [Xenorhabdus griffiniae]
MPENDEVFIRLCLVWASFGSISGAGYDYWDTEKKQWEEHENHEVTHWCYI